MVDGGFFNVSSAELRRNDDFRTAPRLVQRCLIPDSKALGKEIMASIKGEDSLSDKEIERKPSKSLEIMPSGLLFSF